jgi:hypothetical protein
MSRDGTDDGADRRLPTRRLPRGRPPGSRQARWSAFRERFGPLLRPRLGDRTRTDEVNSTRRPRRRRARDNCATSGRPTVAGRHDARRAHGPVRGGAGRRARPSADPGQHDLEAPSGAALLCHQDAAYLPWLEPPNMTTCWMALDDTRPTRGPSTTCAARTRGRARRSAGPSTRPTTGSPTSATPCPRARSSTSCRSRSRRAAPRSMTAGRSTAAHRTSGRRPAPLDHLAHGLDRDALGRRTPASDLLPLPQAR